MKKTTSIAVALCITAGGAFAAGTWISGTGGLWTDGANWSGGSVPANNDGESILVRASEMGGVAAASYLGPTIQTGDNLFARRLDVEVGTASSITLTMTGGFLTMTRTGGTTNRLRVGGGGSSGTAVLNMSGGRIWIDSNDNVYVPGENDLVRVGSGYTGQINMSNDAQIWTRDLLIDASNGSYVDLSDSALIFLKGDQTSMVAAEILAGGLTSNGGAVNNVDYSYDAGSNLTKITAIPEPATMGLFVMIGGGLLWIRNRICAGIFLYTGLFLSVVMAF